MTLITFNHFVQPISQYLRMSCNHIDAASQERFCGDAAANALLQVCAVDAIDLQRHRASSAEAVSVFTGPWICGLGHPNPDGQDSQTLTANRPVSIECEEEAPEAQSTECEVEVGQVPEPSSYGRPTRRQMMSTRLNQLPQISDNAQGSQIHLAATAATARLSAAAHTDRAVPIEMVATYTIKEAQRYEHGELAAFWSNNSVDASAPGSVDELLAMTEHKEQSHTICGVAAPTMAVSSNKSPQLRRLLIREVVCLAISKHPDQSNTALNEASQQGHHCQEATELPAKLRPTFTASNELWATFGKNDGLAINQPTAQPTAALTEGRLQRSRVSTDIRRVFEQQAMKQLVQSPVQNPQTGFFELGLKSGDLMELSTKLSDALDRPIQVSTLFDYPTMDALLEHFRGVVGEKKMSYALQQTNVVPAAPVVASASCVLPGGVSSPQQLGSTLSQGHHGAICRVPPERWSLAEWWDPDPAASNKMYTQHGGFLGAGVVQSFDAVFFGFSKTEARTMSPSQRLVLEHAVQVLCGTNQSIADLRGQKIGVFVGSCHHDWEHLECNKNSSSPYTTTGIAASVLAG